MSDSVSLVVDASAFVDVLIDSPLGPAVARRVRSHRVNVPAHFDAEVLSALGRLHRAGELTDRQVGALLRRAAAVRFRRHPVGPLLSGAWRRRHNLSLDDALYAELNHQLGDTTLITTDHGLHAATKRSELITADG